MANGLSNIDQFKGFINSQTIRAQVGNSFKDKEMAGAFLSSMIDLYSGDTALQKCDPEKVALEAVKAAALHLPLVKALGYAYVVPYKNVPTFTIGYKGLIQLAMRTGQYKIINADVVYEGELKSLDKLSGIPDISGQRTSDKVVGYFAYFRLINGHEHVFYMSKEDVQKHAERFSPSYNSGYSPWKTDFDKMAMKTVLKQLLSKWGPTSTEMQKAEQLDEKTQAPIQAPNKTVIDIDGETGEVISVSKNQGKEAPAESEPNQPANAPFMEGFLDE